MVGRRDRARGFVEAPQILRGQFVKDVGGGVSQFATTMFNAVFFSGMKDIEHHPHSYYISRYPPGREATVSFPQPDLKWQNDSPDGVLVKTSYTQRSITVTFWGTKRYEIESVTGERTRIKPFGKEYVDRDDCTPASGAEGFDIVVTRVFKKNGVVIRREPFKTRYLPEPNFICGPPPPGQPAKQPPPSS
jgi:vancomycin resistance protein YoaR